MTNAHGSGQAVRTTEGQRRAAAAVRPPHDRAGQSDGTTEGQIRGAAPDRARAPRAARAQVAEGDSASRAQVASACASDSARKTPHRLTDLQRDVIRRLEEGQHLTGPVTVATGTHAAHFGFVPPGAKRGPFGPVARWSPNGMIVRSLVAKRILQIHTCPTTGRRTVRLTRES